MVEEMIWVPTEGGL